MRRPPRRLWITVTVAALAMPAVASPAPQYYPKLGPTKTGPGTAAAARKYLEGRWGLLSFELFPADGPPVSVPGSGTLTYDDFGNLEIEIRVDAATAALLEASGIPHANGVVSLKGRTAIDLQSQTLTYFVKGQPPLGAPAGGPLSLNRQRYWTIEADVLTLTTKADDGRPLSSGRWRKVP
jgi:hypothetical protein